MRRNLIRVTALVLLVALVLAFGGCAASSTLRPSSKARKAVATAGNLEILYDELYFLANRKIVELEREYGEDALSDPERIAELEEFVWGNLLTREHALISVGLDYGVNVEKGDIAENVQALVENMIETSHEGDRDAYAESLNEQYLTDRYLRTYYYAVQPALLPTAIVKAMMEGEESVNITDEEALEIIETEFVRTVQVVMEKGNGKTDAENRANAEAIAQKLAAIGDDQARYSAMYDEIGGIYNNDYTDTTGNGYYFCRGVKEAAYEEVAFELEEYESSGVIETDEAYCVIMRLPQDPVYVEQNLSTLKDDVYLVKMNDAVEKRFAEMKLEKTRFGESLDLCALPEIDAAGGEGIYIVIWAVVGVVGVAGVLFLVRVLLARRRAVRGGKKK